MQKQQISNDDGDFELFEGSEKYNTPSEKSVIVDSQKQEIIDKTDLSPIQLILASSKESGIKLKTLKFDSRGNYDTKCRKNGCNGRGYTGFKDGFPIPCSCLFEKTDKKEFLMPNRRGIRAYAKSIRSDSLMAKETLGKRLGLHPINRNVWENKGGDKFYPQFKEDKKIWSFSNKNKFESKIVETENGPEYFQPQIKEIGKLLDKLLGIEQND